MAGTWASSQAKSSALRRPVRLEKMWLKLKSKRRSGEIDEQTNEVVAATLNLDVLALGNVVDADVHGGTAGHAAGDFFADEEIRVAG